MRKKIINFFKFSFFIIFILFISFSVVSAGDNGNNMDLGENGDDLNQDNISNIDHDFGVLANGPVSGNNFNAVQAAINSAGVGDTINFLNNVEHASGENAILIDKSLIIEGNGFTIDAKGQSRIFDIRASNVIIQNLILINGRTVLDPNETSYVGGAVFINQSSNLVTFNNTTFINNTLPTTSSIGGAIFSQGGNLTIINSKFSNNYAGRGGAIGMLGAIYSNHLVIEGNNIFENNRANNPSADGGGAITFVGSPIGGSININGNNIFSNNSAGYLGGVLSATVDSISIIGNNSFINNYANHAGGALRIISGQSFILDGTNKFINNSVSNDEGGALTYRGNNFKMSGSNIFENNKGMLGGALFVQGNYFTIEGANQFLNNSALSEGGAIRFYYGGSYSYSSIRGNNIFKDNKILPTSQGKSEGGAISLSAGDYIIDGNNVFENNFADLGGAIYYVTYHARPITITNGNSFINNSAEDGGALYFRGIYSMNIRNNTFHDNNAIISGGAIYIDNVDNGITISQNKFDNNNAGVNGGTIYLVDSNTGRTVYISISNNEISNSSVGTGATNLIDNNGGAIYVYATSRINFYDNIITDCEAYEGAGIYVSNSNFLRFSNNEISNSVADNVGGAIYLYRANNVNITDYNIFDSNYAPEGGAGIYASIINNFIVSGYNEFNNNYADSYGSAIMNQMVYNFLITGNNVFDNNTGYYFGGAIYSDHGENISIVGSNRFSNNFVYGSGGVIYNSVDDLIISGSNLFLGNGASGNGGVIFNDGYYLTITGTNIFRENYAEGYGGVIVNMEGGDFLMNDSNRFESNYAIKEGGVFYNQGDNFHIYGSNTFYNNSALTFRGGVIYNTGAGFEIRGSNNFTENHAEGAYGGAIYTFGSDDFLIEGSNLFINNSAFYGAAIHNELGSYLLITGNNIFRYNHVTGEGGAIYNDDGLNFTIEGDNLFEYNYAEVNGGVLFDYGGANFTITGNNIFRYNYALGSGGIVYNLDSDSFTITGTNTMVYNHAYVGGVFYTSGDDFLIEGSNNISFNYADNIGGVMYSYLSENMIIDGTNIFSSNHAIGDGGVFYLEPTADLNLFDSNVFINNSGHSGGVLFNLGGIVNITSENEFINNTAVSRGGVFYNSGYAFVTENKFINNYAPNGTDIYNEYSDDYSTVLFLTNSYFEGPTSYFVYNGGVLTLKNNTMISPDKKKIYNPGVILSPVTITILNNSTIYANYGDTVNLTAYGTDDVGNIIVGKDSLFLIGNFTNITTTTFNNDGVHFVDYVVDHAGRYFVSVFILNAERGDLTFLRGVLDVSKGNSHITVDVDDVFYGENTVINITLYDDFGNPLTGQVLIELSNGLSINVTVFNGTLSYLIPNFLMPDTYQINVTFFGNENLNTATNSTTFVVGKINTTIYIDRDVGNDRNVSMTFVLDSRINGPIQLTVGNMTMNVNVQNGIALVVLNDLDVGFYNVVAYFAGNQIFNSATGYTNFTITKSTTFLNIFYTVEDNGNVALIVQTDTRATGVVTIDFDGTLRNVTLNNGVGHTIFYNMTSGFYQVHANYLGDNNFYPANNSTNITISFKNVILVAPNIELYYKNGTRFIVYLYDIHHNPVVGANINITINGIVYQRTTDATGAASMAVNLVPGLYNAYVHYGGNGSLDDIQTIATINVISTIVAKDLVKYYRNGTEFYAQYLDGQGKPIANLDVTFNIHGVFYTRTTDANGMVMLTINLNPGYYILTAFHPLDGLQMSYNIGIFANIHGNDLIKYYLNDSQYSVKVSDGQGNDLVNVPIEFNINGVFYIRFTDGDGIATLAINLAPGQYVVTAKNPTNGLLTSNSIQVLPTLLANNTVIDSNNRQPLQMKVLDGQGNPYDNQIVAINIHGSFYERATGPDGIARLNINLNPGSYLATMSYRGYSLSVTITII